MSRADTSSLEAQIDRIYALPLSEFVAARTALAKTLTGEDATRVKGLTKPLAIPWAVNQLFWRARAAYNQLAKSGEKLRAAQLAALSGGRADLHGATASHRKAVADAVAIATKLAAAARVQPAADALGRMLEALSLSEKPPEPPGRFTRTLQPAGFEALAGIAIQPAAPVSREARTGNAARHGQQEPPREPSKAEQARIRRDEEAREQREQRARAEAQRRWRAEAEKAEADVTRAQAIADGARAEWERATKRLEAAEQTLAEVRSRQPAEES